MLHEFLQYAAQEPFMAIVILGIVAATIVGVFRYLAYIIRGDPAILADSDDDE